MKNIAPKILFSATGVFFSTLVTATCLPIQGTVETQSISDFEQVGKITMTSRTPLAFRNAFGKLIITGGLKGTIIGPDEHGNLILDHEIGFPGVGSIISSNDVAQITGFDNQGNPLVIETVPMIATPGASPYGAPLGGAFVGWHTPEGQPMEATGTLNLSTATNTFTYVGWLTNQIGGSCHP